MAEDAYRIGSAELIQQVLGVGEVDGEEVPGQGWAKGRNREGEVHRDGAQSQYMSDPGLVLRVGSSGTLPLLSPWT